MKLCIILYSERVKNTLRTSFLKDGWPWFVWSHCKYASVATDGLLSFNTFFIVIYFLIYLFVCVNAVISFLTYLFIYFFLWLCINVVTLSSIMIIIRRIY